MPRSPILLIRPLTLTSPELYRRGVRPKWAPTVLERRKRAGTSTQALNDTAVCAPTPRAGARSGRADVRSPSLGALTSATNRRRSPQAGIPHLIHVPVPAAG